MAKTRPSASADAIQPNRASRRLDRVFVGIQEAATYLDVNEKTIRRLISSNRLPGYRLGNRVLKVKIADLDKVLTPVGGGAV